MNWYINQTIICVKTHSQGIVKEGEIYTINGLRHCSCKCTKILIDVGIKGYSDMQHCTICDTCYKTESIIRWIGESLFAPLADISELESILNEEKIKA